MQAVVNEAIMNLSFLLAGLGGVLIGLALIWCIRRLIGYRQKVFHVLYLTILQLLTAMRWGLVTLKHFYQHILLQWKIFETWK